MKNIKCVLIGDGTVGKTSLIITYTANFFPSEYVPFVFDYYTKNVMIGNTAVSLQIWDVAGQDDYEKLRRLTYPQTDVFIICFSLVLPDSLSNVESIWVPEIKDHCPNAPYILVGTKSDLRDDFEISENNFISNEIYPICTEKGDEIKKKINAKGYIECSSKRQTNVMEVFEMAIKVSLYSKDENSCCLIF